MNQYQSSAVNPRKRCPSCGGYLPGEFSVCQHCGGGISWVQTEAGKIPCKPGREEYVKNEVAELFERRRLEAEARAQKEKERRIRTCTVGSYTGDQDNFSTRLAMQKCQRCAKKIIRKRVARSVALGCAILVPTLCFLIIQKVQTENARQREMLISEAFEQGDYSTVLSIDPENPKALLMEKNSIVSRAMAEGDFEKVLDVDPTNTEALGMKERAQIKEALSKGDFAAVLEIDPRNREALLMKKQTELRNAESVAEMASLAFERKQNNENLTAVVKALQRLEERSIESTVLGELRSRIRQPYIVWLGTLSVEHAFGRTQSDTVTILGRETQTAAVKLVGSKLVASFRRALGSRRYSAALLDYDRIKTLDDDAARQISTDWLKIPEQDYTQIPTPVLLDLPPAALGTCPASVLRRLKDSDLLSLPARTNTIGMKLKLIPAGKFVMGSEEEKPAHRVTISSVFEIGVFEVTQSQYELVMGTNPSSFDGDENPVEQVSWHDAVEFCRKLSAMPNELSTKRFYRLPTEAEWEYCCRAGTTTEYSFGQDLSFLSVYARFQGNSEGKTHPVGGKQPNPWGLHDIHGNVFEWCSDWHGQYRGAEAIDPVGPKTGSVRVRRGGSWFTEGSKTRSACRDWFGPSFRGSTIGFRVVCIPLD